MIASFREAIINLLSAKLRSFLAILGVLVGTGSVVALISSSQLATAHALAQFKTLGTNLMSIYLQDLGQSNSNTKQFQLSEVPLLLKAPQVVKVAPFTLAFRNMDYDGNSLNGQIVGATESFAEIAKLQLDSGRFVSYLDKNNFYCVIGAEIAKKIKTHTIHPLNHQIKIGHTYCTIIGILKKWPQNLFISADLNTSLIIPLEASYYLSKNTHIENILVRLVQHPNISLAKTQISSILAKILPKKKPSFNSPEQLIELLTKQKATLNWLLIAIGSISLVVGGIGVMNIMLVSVVERRREIGIRMAIGAQQLDILRMFLVESIMLTMFGGFLGVIVGVLTSYFVALFTHWQFYFYLTPVILGFIVSVLVGIISGFYPAWRASKLDPIQTLTE